MQIPFIWPPPTHTHKEYLDFPANGQKSKLSVTVTGYIEIEKLSRTIPCVWPIPFLQCVLFFKIKTSDRRLEVSQKPVAQRRQAQLQHQSEMSKALTKALVETTFHSKWSWLLLYKKYVFVETA